jgi:UDP-N-acetylmuramoyl-L-alanyl-D-glutamate--2,6-diaminopimelate ligase
MAFHPTPRLLGWLLSDTVGAELITGDPDTPIGGISQDSRRLEAGDLFVAVPGLQQDGLTFLPQALARGAAALAAERLPDERVGIPEVLLVNARQALADLSAAFYGHPSRHLPIVGVTGTDGKTSTTHLLSAVLTAHGLRTGWLTTVNTRIGDEIRANAADHTTPEAPLVQQTLAEMVHAHLDVGILETSSHALALDRVRGVRYQVGVFTNLSPEHLNFHQTMEAYREAKQRLFAMLPADGLAVLNADDPASQHMRMATAARVLTYGLDAPADLRGTDIRLSPSGTSFTVQHAGVGQVDVQTKLVGRFNVANWLAAYGAATRFGASLDDLAAAAAHQAPVPGRMNLVDQGQPFAVVVDFAHTPQALEKALDTVRSLLPPEGRVFLAFGLAGGRDYANRPIMGALAARKSDSFVITMDDPYDEDPMAIARAIEAGIPAGATASHHIELDRRRAIRALLAQARPGDAVLLAGKGHEQRMMVGQERLPWNDTRAASEVLAELGYADRAVP